MTDPNNPSQPQEPVIPPLGTDHPQPQQPSGPVQGGPPPNYYAPQPAGGGPRRSWLFVAIGVVVVAALVVGGFVVARSRGTSTGASSPDGAALDLLGAGSKRDSMGMVSLIAPGEAGGFADTLKSAQGKAENAGVQQGGGLNGLTEGSSLTTRDVTTKVEKIRDNLAKVTFTGGTLTTEFDPDKANQGLQTMAGDDLPPKKHETVDLPGDLTTQSDDGTTIDPFVMAVEVDGRWYVSPSYTIAQYAAETEGVQGATASNGSVATKTFSSPEAATQGFLDAYSQTTRTGSLTPLAQAMPAYYGELITSYPKFFHDSDPAEDGTVEFSGGKFSSHDVDGTTFVKIDHLDFTATDEDGERTTGSIDGECARVEGEGRECMSDADPSGSGVDLQKFWDYQGIVTTQDAHGWHVDPEQTIMRTLSISTQRMDDNELYRLLGIDLSVPEMALKIDPDATMSGESAAVTLKHEYSEDRGEAVVRMHVTSGEQVTVRLSDESMGSDDYYLAIATKQGWVGQDDDDEGYGDDYGYSSSTERTFTPTRSGDVSIVVVGPKGADVTVTRS